MKKIIVFLTVLALFFTQIPFEAEASTSEEEYQKGVQNIISVVEKNVIFSSDGIELVEKNKIMSELKQQDINMLNKLSELQGHKLDKPMTKSSIIKDLEIHLDNLNEEIASGKLTMLDNGTMIDSNDKNFYIQGGSTYNEKKLWGVRRYMSTTAAYNYVYKLRDLNSVATGLVVASVIFGPYGVYPASVNGATALWANQLANRIDYHNNRTSRGIIADIYWIPAFNIKTQ